MKESFVLFIDCNNTLPMHSHLFTYAQWSKNGKIVQMSRNNYALVSLLSASINKGSYLKV